MDARRETSRSETLSERLLRLGPGDECLCCGSRLRTVALGSKRPAVTLADEGHVAARRSALPLVCPECGCEVDFAETPRGAGGRNILGAAA